MWRLCPTKEKAFVLLFLGAAASCLLSCSISVDHLNNTWKELFVEVWLYDGLKEQYLCMPQLSLATPLSSECCSFATKQ